MLVKEPPKIELSICWLIGHLNIYSHATKMAAIQGACCCHSRHHMTPKAKSQKSRLKGLLKCLIILISLQAALLLFSDPPGNLILFHKILVKDRTSQLSFIQVSKFRFQMFYTFSKNGRKTCKTLNNLVGGSSLLNLILPAISCCNVVMERNITRVQNCSDITIFLVFVFLSFRLVVFLTCCLLSFCLFDFLYSKVAATHWHSNQG